MFLRRRITSSQSIAFRARVRTFMGIFSLLGLLNPTAAQGTDPFGDVNGDADVDLIDHSVFVNCMAGAGVAPDPGAPTTTQDCLDAFDGEGDGDVDSVDFAEFQVAYTGSALPRVHNLVFVSSVAVRTDLGGAAAYDVRCNQLATSAGLNNPAGNAFVAWISDAGSNARTRLGATARGFMRMDGVAFADSQSSLFNNNVVFNPIRIDEYGNDVGFVAVMTGTNGNGSTNDQTCMNWTSSGGNCLVLVGSSAGGPGFWTAESFAVCQGIIHIYCMEKTQSVPLTPAISPGKRVFVSASNFVPGSGVTPDQLCEAEKPPDVVSAGAMIARPTATAVSVLNPLAQYVRVDGQRVGTGVELAAFTNLRSGIWQLGNGTYFNPLVWTGSSAPTTLGTTASTCNNWTVTTGQGVAGRSTAQSPAWWSQFTRNCTGAYRIYCFER